MWWKGRLAQGTANVEMDWNRKTFSVVDGLAHGTTSVRVAWNKETSNVIMTPRSGGYGDIIATYIRRSTLMYIR